MSGLCGNCFVFLLLLATVHSQFLLPNPLLGKRQGNFKDGTLKLPGITIGGGPVPKDYLPFETDYGGLWELASKDSGANAMHINLLPNNKVIMYDALAFHMSTIKLPNGVCVAYRTDQGSPRQDCWSHAVEYDVATAIIRPLTVTFDPWCSSGGLAVDGTLVSTGGWLNGSRTVRYMGTCVNCNWREYFAPLADARWYATQATLPDGRFILVGGRRSFSYEFVPREGDTNPAPINFPFLYQTTDLDENNLYPFVHLSPDGNVFIFANNRSVLLDPNSNKIIREYPVLDGGSRNYPASGMSALLPIYLDVAGTKIVPADVIVCGGAKPGAYVLAQKGIFIPALQDCNRLQITDPLAKWTKELMPSPRVMGDLQILPNGDLLILNGAKQGTAAWVSADLPNLTPVLYSPEKPINQRFKELHPTTIPRMYHSSSTVLPDGKVLVGGSNPNAGYNFTGKYPTEMRIEKFSPPYLDPMLATKRPVIMMESSEATLMYGQKFTVTFELNEMSVDIGDVQVTMYAPPFTTHGYSMNQRLLVLGKLDLQRTLLHGDLKIEVLAPPTSAIAPPGFYLLFVVYRGIPSEGTWVQIK